MRYFRMANGTKYFLASEEARKSGRIRVSVGKSIWHTILPGNTLCTGEEISQELRERGLPSLEELGRIQLKTTVSWWKLHHDRRRLRKKLGLPDES